MTSILLVSDCGVPSGYGRIADEVATRLVKRGYSIVAASVLYDGLLPARRAFSEVLPYHVASLRDRPDWAHRVKLMAESAAPDIVLVIQDATHVEAVRHSGIDWSQHAFVAITPVDGKPIAINWQALIRGADAAMTISEFGVQAYREAGIQVGLCRPGVDTNYFYEHSPEERLQLRGKINLPLDSFIVGTFAMNQGRKLVPNMLEIFFKFAIDKPNCYYLLDMEPASAGGWDIMGLCKQNGWDTDKLLFRQQVEATLPEVRDRMNLLNVQMVISEREGYGLPLVESQACGVIAMAQDWSSGNEITGGGKHGLLVRPIDYKTYSGWGGARNAFPEIEHAVELLNQAYGDLPARWALKEAGKKWARSHTWDNTTDQVEHVLRTVMLRRQPPAPMPAQQAEIAPEHAEQAPNQPAAPAPAQQGDGHLPDVKPAIGGELPEPPAPPQQAITNTEDVWFMPDVVDEPVLKQINGQWYMQEGAVLRQVTPEEIAAAQPLQPVPSEQTEEGE